MEDIIKLEKKCLDCNGVGVVSTMESVYPGTPDYGIQAPIGSETCENCAGTGEEQDEEIVKERLLENDSVIAKLQEYLVDEVREINGRGINKDNCEDMFENWLSDLSLEEITKILK